MLTTSYYMAISIPFEEGPDGPSTVLLERTTTTSTLHDGVRSWDVGLALSCVTHPRGLTWPDIEVHVQRFLGHWHRLALRLERDRPTRQRTGGPMVLYEDIDGRRAGPDVGDRLTIVNLDRTFQGASVTIAPATLSDVQIMSEYVPLGLWSDGCELDLGVMGVERTGGPEDTTSWSFRLMVGEVTPAQELLPWEDVDLFLIAPGDATDGAPEAWPDYPLVANLSRCVPWARWRAEAEWRVENDTIRYCIEPLNVIVVEGIGPCYEAGDGQWGAIAVVATGPVVVGHANLPTRFP